MKISSSEFDREDPRKKGYSLVEIDITANYGDYWNRARVSLRKNIAKNEYEVYAFYYRTRKEEVLYSTPSLDDCVSFINKNFNTCFVISNL
ncbi:MAG: hypothetical protein ACP5T9_05340 [Thermoplasmata archaeon]